MRLMMGMSMLVVGDILVELLAGVVELFVALAENGRGLAARMSQARLHTMKAVAVRCVAAAISAAIVVAMMA